MICVEFTQAGKAEEVARQCIRERLLLLTCGIDKNVVRWVPPLVVNEAEISEALHIFGRALEDK
jgi:4-aminobutyrate aminotransferase